MQSIPKDKLENIDLDLNNTIPEEHSLNHRKFSYSEASITDLNVSEDEEKEDFVKKFLSQNKEESRIKYVNSIIIPSKDNIQKDLENWRQTSKSSEEFIEKIKECYSNIECQDFQITIRKVFKTKDFEKVVTSLAQLIQYRQYEVLPENLEASRAKEEKEILNTCDEDKTLRTEAENKILTAYNETVEEVKAMLEPTALQQAFYNKLQNNVVETLEKQKSKDAFDELYKPTGTFDYLKCKKRYTSIKFQELTESISSQSTDSKEELISQNPDKVKLIYDSYKDILKERQEMIKRLPQEKFCKKFGIDSKDQTIEAKCFIRAFNFLYSQFGLNEIPTDKRSKIFSPEGCGDHFNHVMFRYVTFFASLLSSQPTTLEGKRTMKDLLQKVTEKLKQEELKKQKEEFKKRQEELKKQKEEQYTNHPFAL